MTADPDPDEMNADPQPWFDVLKKKISANFQRIIELFTPKNCQKALQNMVFGSGIRDPGSGMGKNQDPGSGINIPDPQHWFCEVLLLLCDN